MKKLVLLIACLSLLFGASAQVSINSDGSQPNPSAMLDVKSTTKGFLPPRMTRAEINAIVSPVNGLMVFCADCESGGNGAMVMFLNGMWHTFTINCMVPMDPTAGVHTSSLSQIIWNWNTVPDATGYKWNTTDNYAGATDMGTATTKTETGLTCNTAYSRYVWAYNTCGNSGANTLMQSTTQSPAVGVTITSSANPVCAGTSVTFTATSVNGGSTPSWQWKKNGASVSGATNSTYIYAPTHGDLITCQLTSSNPCTPNNPAVSNGITMTVNALVTPSVTIAASANPVCAGTQVTFTATPVNGGTTPAYQWKKDGSNVSGATSVTYSYIPAQGDQITCQMTSNAACPQTNPVTSGNITMTVNALPATPGSGSHIPAETQITWNWNTVAGATGYKWSTTDVYATATDMGTATTMTETSLSCNTSYTRYAWAYSECGASSPVTLTQSTLACGGGFTCGQTLTINHVAGDVAPVSKNTTYGTVTGIPGEPTKCWITSNLGSDHQATSVNDATEASAGWYWQFNRKQGYKHDGSTLTPAWTITSINENSDWLTANDPCNLELGTAWRLPTYTEWSNVDNTGGWTNWNGPWGSGLKLHAGGFLYTSNGSLGYRGTNGNGWSSTQANMTTGWAIHFRSGFSGMDPNDKAYSFNVRCLRE